MDDRKAVVVGAGQVGATVAYTLAISGLVSDLTLIDINRDKALGEVLDIAHGMPLCPPAEIRLGDYSDCAGARVVILTAGANQKPGETRMDLIAKNTKVLTSVVPQVARYAPDAVLLVVTNPVDPLTYQALRISGFPASRVLGSGTVLDSSRLRYLIARHTGVDARNVHTYVLGEHGETEFPVFSRTTIGGLTAREYCRACARCDQTLAESLREEFDQEVRKAADTIIRLKGATYYAVAVAVRRIVEAILRDEHSILTVSSLLDGEYGFSDLCLSVPCLVGAQGVLQRFEIALSDEERAALSRSAQAVGKMCHYSGV